MWDEERAWRAKTKKEVQCLRWDRESDDRKIAAKKNGTSMHVKACVWTFKSSHPIYYLWWLRTGFDCNPPVLSRIRAHFVAHRIWDAHCCSRRLGGVIVRISADLSARLSRCILSTALCPRSVPVWCALSKLIQNVCASLSDHESLTAFKATVMKALLHCETAFEECNVVVYLRGCASVLAQCAIQVWVYNVAAEWCEFATVIGGLLVRFWRFCVGDRTQCPIVVSLPSHIYRFHILNIYVKFCSHGLWNVVFYFVCVFVIFFLACLGAHICVCFSIVRLLFASLTEVLKTLCVTDCDQFCIAFCMWVPAFRWTVCEFGGFIDRAFEICAVNESIFTLALADHRWYSLAILMCIKCAGLWPHISNFCRAGFWKLVRNISHDWLVCNSFLLL